MKANISLLYDEDCPLCRWYTAKFVQYQFLTPQGRVSYTKHIQDFKGVIDPDLAQTKIACFNHDTKEVTYGVDSLLVILSQRCKLIGTIGKFKPVNYLLQLLYLLVSYNRKIVAPGPKQKVDCACEPSRSVFWRFTFIALISWFTYLIVHWYFNNFLTPFLVENPVNDFVLLTLQLLFQTSFFLLFSQKNLYDYLGHLAFTSFLGALVLLGFGLLIQVLGFIGIDTPFFAVICFGITICFLFFEHKRRIQLKDWDYKLSLTWIVFRILIYPLVFHI
ncbi:hypothetical protein [Fluviicola sp.]|uniref:hypothetical protein n=1 Tax=Fluviicola sp. TaxID=1917219 RepID=UPI002627DA80|nr:hypothetical protein [Fluviicola sp.]